MIRNATQMQRHYKTTLMGGGWGGALCEREINLERSHVQRGNIPRNTNYKDNYPPL